MDFLRGEIILKLKKAIAVQVKERQGKNDWVKDDIPQLLAECNESCQEFWKIVQKFKGAIAAQASKYQFYG